jgi:hypothetical protein
VFLFWIRKINKKMLRGAWYAVRGSWYYFKPLAVLLPPFPDFLYKQ